MNRALVALAPLLFVASCASDPSTVAVSPPTTPTSAPNVTVSPPAGPGPDQAGRTTTTVAPPAPGGATVVVVLPAWSGPGPASSMPGAPGSSAPRYLRPAPVRRLRLQVLVEPAAAPRQGTLDHIARLLRSATGKPVTVLPAGLGSTDSRTWDDASVASAAAARAPALAADEALIQMLFLAGTYRDGAGVLGVAVNGGVAAIFTERVAATATGLAGPDRLEQAVAAHELGHLLGLVDLYLHTGRADPEHPGHSSNPRSVMYWAVETDVVGDLLTGGPPVDFDAADRADLAAIRSG